MAIKDNLDNLGMIYTAEREDVAALYIPERNIWEESKDLKNAVEEYIEKEGMPEEAETFSQDLFWLINDEVMADNNGGMNISTYAALAYVAGKIAGEKNA